MIQRKAARDFKIQQEAQDMTDSGLGSAAGPEGNTAGPLSFFFVCFLNADGDIREILPQMWLQVNQVILLD